MNTAKRTLISAVLAAAAIAATAQSQVSIKGSVITLGPAQQPVRIALVVDGIERDVPVNRNGNFSFTLEEGQRARMISGCNGFIGKEVLIDAAHAGVRGGKRRTIRFDVELEPQDAWSGGCPALPAGSIAFAKDSGQLLVAHGVQMEPHDPAILAVAP